MSWGWEHNPLVIKQSGRSCGDRVAVVFFKLVRGFGREALTKHFIPSVARRFAWAPKCTPTKALSPLFYEAVGSNEARRVFDSFVLHPASADPPLVQLILHPNRTLSAIQTVSG